MQYEFPIILRFYSILFIFSVLLGGSLHAQEVDNLSIDSLEQISAPAFESPMVAMDSTSALPLADTKQSIDTIPNATESKSKETEVKFADSDLEEQIIYGAVDSQRYDNKNKLMHLYGDAFVNYTDKVLKADLIILDMENKIAEAMISSVKRNSVRPTFSDNGKTYEYKRLRYNFETEKGIVLDAITNEGEFRVHGAKTKYVSGGDNLYGTSDVIYNANSLVTTCNHPDHPHFGFRAKKMKVVSEKVAVAGPSRLEIAGIPTPLWIPFGFFPLTESTSTGLIFPEGYQFYSEDLGFGLAGIGWYFPINDRIHTRITADIYSSGTYGLYSVTDYRKRYKYSGSVNLSFNDYKREAELPGPDGGFGRLSEKGFSIRLSHTQDGKAHPYRTIGGSINIVGNDNVRRNNFDAGSSLTSQYTSNLSFTHKMPRTPFSFRMGLSHNQNTNNNIMNLTLPDIALTMNTIYPLERKNVGSNEKKWYEKLALGYSSRLKVQTTTTDTTLFTRETIENAKSGMEHKANLSLSTRVLKYFNLTPSANYKETWVLNTIQNNVVQTQGFIPPTEQDSLQFKLDSIYQTLDSIEMKTLSSGGTFRTYGAGVNLSTQIFGTKTFSKGPIRGIRHLVKPRVGYNFSPDQKGQIDTIEYNDGRERTLTYSPYDRGPFGSPGFSGLRSQVTYGVDNVVEMKYFSRKDSTEKKFKLFDRVSLSGNYNFAADSLKFSTHSLTSSSRFFGGITTLDSRWLFDPYVESNNRRVNKTVWSDRKKLARMENGFISLSTRFTFGKLRKWLKEKDKEKSSVNDEEGVDYDDSGLFADGNLGRRDRGSAIATGEDVDSPAGNDHLGHDHKHDHDHDHDNQEEEEKKRSVYDLLDKFSIRHDMKYNFYNDNEVRSSEMTTHSLSLTGSFELTENWGVNIGSIGYDFAKKSPTYSTVTFTRKLHCWDMSITWTPIGRANTYSFFIGVRSNALSFLKYNYGQNRATDYFGI